MLPDDLPQQLHYKNVALLLKVSPLTIIRMIEEKEIPSSDGIHVSRTDLDAYLEQKNTLNIPIID